MAIPITLRQCSKTFADGTRALQPLDLTIAASETIVLLGPSGCGKTTTLRIIAGLETPDPGGLVLFDKSDVTPAPIEKRHVGMVFQSYALFPNMTVEGNIEYGLRVRGMAAIAPITLPAKINFLRFIVIKKGVRTECRTSDAPCQLRSDPRPGCFPASSTTTEKPCAASSFATRLPQAPAPTMSTSVDSMVMLFERAANGA